MTEGTPQLTASQMAEDPARAVHDLRVARADLERLREALDQIDSWANAYPETVFKEPDFDRMREVLEAAGMRGSLDAAHGTWGRRILSGIREITRTALSEHTQPTDTQGQDET